MPVELKYSASARAQVQEEYGERLQEWLNSHTEHQIDGGEIIFDEALLQNGFHTSTSIGGNSVDNHLTIQLSNAALRAANDYHTLHWYENGTGEVFPQSQNVYAAEKRKKKSQKRNQKRREKKDPRGGAGGASGGGSSGNASGNTSTKTILGGTHTSSVDSTTGSAGTQTGKARTASGVALMGEKDPRTKSKSIHAGATSAGGPVAFKEFPGGPNLSENHNQPIKVSDGKKSGETRALPHTSRSGTLGTDIHHSPRMDPRVSTSRGSPSHHQNVTHLPSAETSSSRKIGSDSTSMGGTPNAAQVRHVPIVAVGSRPSLGPGQGRTKSDQNALSYRDRPGASVSAGLATSGRRNVNATGGPSTITTTKNRRPENGHVN